MTVPSSHHMGGLDSDLNQALQYHNTGKFQYAKQIYQTILGRDSNHADALHLLGVLSHQTGDHHRAVQLIEKAICINPSNPFYYGNLGVVYHSLDLVDRSISCYHKAQALKPDYTEAFNNLANIFRKQGRLTQAAAMYQKALSLQPDDAATYNNLGHVYRDLGCVRVEIACYEKALMVDPDYAQSYLNLGNALQYQGELDKAIICYQKALQKKSNFPEVYNNLGSVFIMQGQLNEATQCYQKALLMSPYYAEAYNNLGSIHQNQGKVMEGIFCFRKALEIKPDYIKAHSNLLYAMHYDPDIGSDRLYEAATHWWQQHGLKKTPTFHPVTNSTKSGRIKIGYISPDFREHSVSYFFLPLLRHQNRDSFEIFCYSEVKREDEITYQIKELSDHWRPIAWLRDRAIADQVRQDGIDILVDLAGHTAENRLPVFAYKPAPVQITWLGYPGTTGMPDMDFRLTDEIADPPGEADEYHSETLVRLPQGFLCYGPPEDAPDVSGLPARKNGHITFGSFNNLPKINPEVIDLWSRLLDQVADSRLLLKSKQFIDEQVRQRFLDLFSDCGIGAERITLLPRAATTAGHLALYHQVDIALDPFPYNGTTTTCESLWMGVPVITLRGDRHAGRVGASILTRIGLGEMVAENQDQYVGIGIKLAQDMTALENLRADLRSHMQSSVICDGKSFARIMEKSFHNICFGTHIDFKGNGNSTKITNYPSTKTKGQQEIPTLSLVTPSYNQGAYLEECIDSALSQSYPNLEYIIMDGGSTDNSVEIIKKYEKYLTFWQSRPDGGQYAAINEGFRKTKGQIMTWLNSDDKFHPNAFLTVAGVFMLRNDVEWISGRLNTLNEQGEQFWICEYLIPWARSKYLKKEFMDPWIQQEGTFWRRQLWERSGSTMRTDLNFAGDLELWTRFFRYARLYSVDTLLAGYRFQSKSKTRLFMDKYLQEANGVLDEELQLLQNGVHKELLSSPEAIKINEIRKGLKLIHELDSSIASFIKRQGGWITFKGGHQTALEFYEKSIELDPNVDTAHNSLGMLYWQNGEVKKAMREFAKALRINPCYPDAVVNLGDILMKIKEDDKAKRLYAAYLAANPSDRELLKAVANIGT